MGIKNKVMTKIKPSLLGKTFKVLNGDGQTFYIMAHHLPTYFTVIGKDTANGYMKTTVWQLVDKKQWVVQ